MKDVSSSTLKIGGVFSGTPGIIEGVDGKVIENGLSLTGFRILELSLSTVESLDISESRFGTLTLSLFTIDDHDILNFCIGILTLSLSHKHAIRN